MAATAATLLQATSLPPSSSSTSPRKGIASSLSSYSFTSRCPSFQILLFSSLWTQLGSKSRRSKGFVVACLPSAPKIFPAASTKLYVSGLSFRTTEESLRNAFQSFGRLVEVNLVMDRIANRPRGFAFLRYDTEEESKKAIEGMHGKFLDGRVIFVEVAKPRSELRQGAKQRPKQF
ncbi:organelle RRM domain-containing protein 2, mitochondrial-like [Typha latifolia]|uniref:organelle RRM domain-containing protein 2, mitochondrial-like n=1 Tax=Typha latifolia TaxID=4733 RepID=UPI003C2D3E08